MKFVTLQAALVGFYAAVALASPAPAPGPGPVPDPQPEPVLEERATVDVDLPSGGTMTGRSLLNVESFNAIPFADPPVGDLRLKPPRKFSGTFGKRDGTGIAPACPQMFLSRESLGIIGKIANDLLQIPFLKVIAGQEDCLTVNVQRPAGTKAGDKLPVLFWIFGGGFELGATQTYDATSLLATAVGQKQPFVFVAVNYRVGGFGFMPGKEILKDGSANLGLLDQRMGLEWVADNIAAFGGDPSKVTIWGESAGSISVFDQMVLYGGNATYKGKPLFRGAIMNSGTVVPADPVDCPKGQEVYDKVVREAGCSGAQDTLKCLRKADYKTFLNAANSVPGIISYQSLALSYLPRPDGTALPDSPDRLGLAGKYHAVPMIIGDQEDEGSIFAITTLNVTSVDKAVDYLSQYYFHSAPKAKLKEFIQLYEPSLTQGSPFRTGILNEWYPGFKRMAAVLGDLTFTLTRRVTLSIATTVKPDVPAWSYLSSYNYGTPIVGTFHASDILQVFYGILPNNAMKSCRTYYFNFLYNLDPNKGVGGYANWPKWQDTKKLMWFRWGFANDILDDNFRSAASNFISNNREIFRI
ncbi:cholinesterase [Pochonia chlamydosporia 170]|uniref:Carboxylic ester hydrolase n=1 Tax=Pochonia chlamydosporia 170 TaxID=1380566 RepID=A0A179FXI4_METCM|nr:cholinesterase [Pochonia chlamydosporia 170]OAQ69689.1 cholinesterase [Pochonia chlamydosporia 170]